MKIFSIPLSKIVIRYFLFIFIMVAIAAACEYANGQKQKTDNKERTYTLTIPENQVNAVYLMLHNRFGDMTNNQTSEYQKYLPDVDRQLTQQSRKYFVTDSLTQDSLKRTNKK